MGRRYSHPTRLRDRKCPYCGCYFTPQGLSGHIRYAHKAGKRRDGLFDQYKDLEMKKLEMLAFAKGCGASSEEIEEATKWLDDWLRIIMRGAFFGVQFTEADFRNYILIRILQATNRLR